VWLFWRFWSQPCPEFLTEPSASRIDANVDQRWTFGR
jgi:hypothetical protein